jgi:uracil-DNA glycosylase
MAALDELRTRAAGCTNCGLYRDATQTVFGDGRDSARLMLLGEQPGDSEDLAGEPFVGPAGRLLDRALEQAGVVREDVYVTNVVKHFKFKRQGEVATMHPSAVLRVPDQDGRADALGALVDDLRLACKVADGAA